MIAADSSNSFLDEASKLKKRQRKSLEFNYDSQISTNVSEPHLIVPSNSYQTEKNVYTDDMHQKLVTLLVKAGYGADYLDVLKSNLLQLQEESNSQRAARNYRDFNIANVQRILYTPDQKLKILEVYDEFHGNNEVPGTSMFNFIRSIPGYEKVYPSVIYRWKMSPKECMPTNGRTGRPVCKEFEHEVLNEAVRVIARELSGQETVEKDLLLKAAGILSASVTVDSDRNNSKEFQTLRIIREAANAVHDRYYNASECESIIVNADGSQCSHVQKWKHHTLTNRLSFSTKWVLALLSRNDVHHWDVPNAILNPETASKVAVESTKTVGKSTSTESKTPSKRGKRSATFITVVSAGYSSVTNEVIAHSSIVEKPPINSSIPATTSHTTSAFSTADVSSLCSIAPIILTSDQLNLVQQVWTEIICQTKTGKAQAAATTETSSTQKRKRTSEVERKFDGVSQLLYGQNNFRMSDSDDDDGVELEV